MSVPKGYKMPPRSQEFRQKMREINLGRKATPETIQKLRNSHRGKKQSEETKRKKSESMRGHVISAETRKKIGDANRGNVAWSKGKKLPPFSEEHRKAMSIARKGKKLSEAHRQKLRDAHKRNPHHNRHWKGGISKLPNYASFIQRRREIRKLGNGGSHNIGDWENLKAQYNWRCPCCLRLEPEIKLTEDHVVPISKGGSNNIENIQPLCRSCNSKKGALILERFVSLNEAIKRESKY